MQCCGIIHVPTAVRAMTAFLRIAHMEREPPSHTCLVILAVLDSDPVAGFFLFLCPERRGGEMVSFLESGRPDEGGLAGRFLGTGPIPDR